MYISDHDYISLISKEMEDPESEDEVELLNIVPQ
jgi:hypothetical protein